MKTSDLPTLYPTDKRPTLDELMAIAYKYYPRWDPEREPFDKYLEGYDDTPEFRRLMHFIGTVTRDNRKWNELLTAVKAQFPDYYVADGRPPSYEIPSYQLVLEYPHPPGTKLVNFRLSFFVPLYDYYETYRDKDDILISEQLYPSAETAAIVAVIEREIEHRFRYRKLDPELGKTPVPGIGINTLSPGEVDLAGALFESVRRW